MILRAKRAEGRLLERPDEYFSREKIIKILELNPAVGGIYEIAEMIADECELREFHKGEKFIVDGELIDDVFFILSGEANVIIKRDKGTIRKEPLQVGEMAAIKLGTRRSATLSVRTEKLYAAKITGDCFRQIQQKYSGFTDRLNADLQARFRERIDSVKAYKESVAPRWLVVSLASSLIASLSFWYFAPNDWTAFASVLGALALGIAVFIIIQMFNPAFIWRRAFLITLLSFISMVAFDRLVQVKFDGSFGTISFDYVSKGADQDWPLMVIIYLIFAFVMLLCAYNDNMEK